MTVLHVISGLGGGGAEAMMVQLAICLQGRGFQQHVISLTGRGRRANDLERQKIPVTYLQLSSVPRAIPALWATVALVCRLNPDVIQGWMYHGDLVAALAHRAVPNHSKRRLFWGIRASNMDDARYRRLIKWGARLSAWPDAIIANSSAGAHFHVTKGYRPRRLEVIPNGIDVAKFHPDPARRQKVRAELGIDPNAVIVIHVARVDPMKDHATSIAALAALPNVTGLLVGIGTEALVLPRNVRGLGERADVTSLYAASDIVLSSSAFGEGFSNAIAEGMSAGLVPVATDVGDVRSIVGETGPVVSRGDVSALVCAIRNEAGRSLEEQRRRGLRARDRIAQFYSVERMTERFVQLYR